MKYLYRTEMLVFRHQQHFPWLPLYFSTLLCTFSLKRLTAPRDVNGPSHLVFHGVAKDFHNSVWIRSRDRWWSSMLERELG
jgi:hypothetical protein